MPEADLEFEELQDPYGKEFWPEYKGRDGCRTPMVWDSSSQNGGFSSAAHTWLPVPNDHLRHSAAEARADPTSLFHHYCRAIGLRHAHPALRSGEMKDVEAKENVLSFLRKAGKETIFCAFNIGENPAQITLPEGTWSQIGGELNSVFVDSDGGVQLGSWQPCLARRIEQNV